MTEDLAQILSSLEAYSTKTGALDAAQRSGINRSLIKDDGTLDSIWNSILREAYKRNGKLERIVDKASDLYPDQATRLSRALMAYQQSQNSEDGLARIRGQLSADIEAANELYFGNMTLENALTSAEIPTPILLLFSCGVADRALAREQTAGRIVDNRSSAFLTIARDWIAELATKDDVTAAREEAWRAHEHASEIEATGRLVSPELTDAARASARAALSAAWGHEPDLDFPGRLAIAAAESAAWNAAWAASASLTEAKRDERERLRRRTLVEEQRWQTWHLIALIYSFHAKVAADILVSHSIEDYSVAAPLLKRMADIRYTVRIDLRDAIANEIYLDYINISINASRVILVLFGRGELGPWIAMDQASGLARLIDKRNIHLVGVLITGFDAPGWGIIPEALQLRTMLDLRGIDEDEVFNRLIGVLAPPEETTPRGRKRKETEANELHQVFTQLVYARSIPDYREAKYRVEKVLIDHPESSNAKRLLTPA